KQWEASRRAACDILARIAEDVELASPVDEVQRVDEAIYYSYKDCVHVCTAVKKLVETLSKHYHVNWKPLVSAPSTEEFVLLWYAHLHLLRMRGWDSDFLQIYYIALRGQCGDPGVIARKHQQLPSLSNIRVFSPVISACPSPDDLRFLWRNASALFFLFSPSLTSALHVFIMVRFKNRWILVEFLPIAGDEPVRTTELTGKHIWTALRQSVITHFGDTGWGAVGASLNVARDPYRTAWGAVTLLSTIEGQTFVPNVVHVSGTIKHVQLAAIEHNRIIIARYRARAKTAAAYQDSYEEYLKKSTMEIETLQD
ncbi:hypothetical protein EW146_g10460, partial [Bondarzewia mesenterica]